MQLRATRDNLKGHAVFKHQLGVVPQLSAGGIEADHIEAANGLQAKLCDDFLVKSAESLASVNQRPSVDWLRDWCTAMTNYVGISFRHADGDAGDWAEMVQRPMDLVPGDGFHRQITVLAEPGHRVGRRVSFVFGGDAFDQDGNVAELAAATDDRIALGVIDAYNCVTVYSAYFPRA